jgi:glycosyltransferase
MKISIVTATYNSEKNISTCLQSVAGQTHKNIEHLIIDGGSTDKTMEIVKSFPSVSKTVSEPDKGIYDALNKGIQLATGNIIGFLHSDDELAAPDTIQKIVEVFANNNTQGVYGNLIFVNEGDKVVRTWQSKSFERKNIKNGWMPPHPTLFLRKGAYQKHGLFDISFKTAGDYDFMLRVMKDNEMELAYLPEVITRMRMGGASTGNIKQLYLKSKEDIIALRKNGFRFPFLILAAKNFRKLPQLFRR